MLRTVSSRLPVRLSRSSTRAMSVSSKYEDGFGTDLFPSSVSAQSDGFVSDSDTESFAADLLKWARSKGATHYTHSFFPLSGKSSEKHDAFLKQVGAQGTAAFKGKHLCLGEPDGSSFPNGNLRATHTARGYTQWDPQSPPFVLDHGSGSTLFIPSKFFAWTGAALDTKIPLLRSESALTREGTKLFKALRIKGHTRMHSDSGVEQEFFLVDRDMALRRPDLVACGRTLQGAAAAKGQSLDDHYFGTPSHRVLEYLHDAEQLMWRLGIAQSTRHLEVAPGQYEIAPEFRPANLAADQNQLVMRILQEVARKHDLVCLMHEKPFADLNGSGKHNNWSVGTNKIGTLFEPGDNIPNNRLFLVFTIATLRAVDLHADLLRIAIASAGNDHRLGGHEAPPAVLSVYLGDDITEGIEAFVNGTAGHTSSVDTKIDLGVPVAPATHRATVDRNRTSPVAFTGNKFEFRAVGSDQSVAHSSMTLNTILADSMRYLAAEIEAAGAGKTGKEFDAAVNDVLRKTYNAHKRIVFDGDNYSAEWAAEAERRGLPCYTTSADALPHLTDAKNVELFESLGVLTPAELEARKEVYLEQYSTTVGNEAACTLNILNQTALPAGIKETTAAAAAVAAVSAVDPALAKGALATSRLPAVTALVDAGVTSAADLSAAMDTLDATEDLEAKANHVRDNVLPAMNAAREQADKIEALSSDWKLPSYHDMLLIQD